MGRTGSTHPGQKPRGFFVTWSLTWTGLLLAAVFLGLVATFLPRLGRTFWWFDLASHARLQTVLGFGVVVFLALATRRWIITLVALGMLTYNALPLWPYYVGAPLPVPAQEAPALRLVVANLWTDNPSAEDFLAWVREQDPDVLALQEVGAAWHSALRAGLQDWPFSETRVREDNFGMAIYSRIPIDELQWKTLVPGGPISALVRFRWENQSIPLLVTHPIPPVQGWASEQRDQQIKALAQQSWIQERTALVAGDLNATPWSMAFKPLHATPLRDARLGFGYLGTWPARAPAPARIPIDHLLVGPAWSLRSLEVGPPFGSDHLPLCAHLVLHTTP